MVKVVLLSSLAVVRLNAGPLVLSGDLETEVDLLWQAEQARNGKTLFNGKIFSAVEVTSSSILGRVVEYRLLIAQRVKPNLFDVLNVRPVGVSGMFACANGVVFGRRARTMTQDGGRWELCPSGGLDTSKTALGGEVDYCAQILTELQEEVGVGPDVITEIRPYCLVYDLDSHVIDIGITLTSEILADEVVKMHRNAATKEYDELLIVPYDKVARFIEAKRTELVPVSVELLRHMPSYGKPDMGTGSGTEGATGATVFSHPDPTKVG